MNEDEKFEDENILQTFETLMVRLESLDGHYAWNEEIDKVRRALYRAGH